MTKAIPSGFHTITPSLIVTDPAKALDFYKRAFGAQETDRFISPDGKGVMHAHFKVGDSAVMLGGEFPPTCLSPKSRGGTSVSQTGSHEGADRRECQSLLCEYGEEARAGNGDGLTLFNCREAKFRTGAEDNNSTSASLHPRVIPASERRLDRQESLSSTDEDRAAGAAQCSLNRRSTTMGHANHLVGN